MVFAEFDKARCVLYQAPSGLGVHYDSSGPMDRTHFVPRLTLSIGAARPVTYTIHEFTKDNQSYMGPAVAPGIVRPTTGGAHAYLCHPKAAGKTAIAWKDAARTTGYVVQHEVAKLRNGDSSVCVILDLPLTVAGTMQLIADMKTGRFSLLSPPPPPAVPPALSPLSGASLRQIDQWVRTLSFVPWPDTVLCTVCESNPAYTFAKGGEASEPGAYELTHCQQCVCDAMAENPTIQFLAEPCRSRCGQEKYKTRSFCRPCSVKHSAARKCDRCPTIGCMIERNYCPACIHEIAAPRAAERRCVDCQAKGVYVSIGCIFRRCAQCHHDHVRRERQRERDETELLNSTQPICEKCKSDYAISNSNANRRRFCKICIHLCVRAGCTEPRMDPKKAHSCYCSTRCRQLALDKNYQIPMCNKCGKKPRVEGKNQRKCAG
jgi:hypothetical protein